MKIVYLNCWRLRDFIRSYKIEILVRFGRKNRI